MELTDTFVHSALKVYGAQLAQPSTNNIEALQNMTKIYIGDWIQPSARSKDIDLIMLLIALVNIRVEWKTQKLEK